MSGIVPYKDDNPYRQPSLDEAIDFWVYVLKKSPAGFALYFVSLALFFIVLGWLTGELLGKWLDIGTAVVVILALSTIPMMFFLFPSMPRHYETQFKGKLRPDIQSDELRELLMELTRKSLGMGSLVLVAMSVSGTLAFLGARYLQLSDMMTLVLAAALVLQRFWAGSPFDIAIFVIASVILLTILWYILTWRT